jgi:hypothetical protein
MQPLKLAALALLDALDEPDGPFVLLPHAAASSASTPKAAMAGTVRLTEYLLIRAAETACSSGAAVAASPGVARATAGPPVAPHFRPVHGTLEDPKRPALGCPQVRPGSAAWEAVTGGRSRPVAKSKSARPAVTLALII